MATYDQMDCLAGEFKYTPEQVYEMFPHLKIRTMGLYKSNIDKYLTTVGFQGKKAPRASKLSEIVMFMEIAFQSKYKECKNTHFQYVTPPKNRAIPKNDAISEKVKGCESRNAFNNNFKLIGTTFRVDKNLLHTNLDFKGKLYLRLIDTQDNNKSYFFRNDSAVSEFFKNVSEFKLVKSNPKCLISKYLEIKTEEGIQDSSRTKIAIEKVVNTTKNVADFSVCPTINLGMEIGKSVHDPKVNSCVHFYEIRASQYKEHNIGSQQRNSTEEVKQIAKKNFLDNQTSLNRGRQEGTPFPPPNLSPIIFNANHDFLFSESLSRGFYVNPVISPIPYQHTSYFGIPTAIRSFCGVSGSCEFPVYFDLDVVGYQVTPTLKCMHGVGVELPESLSVHILGLGLSDFTDLDSDAMESGLSPSWLGSPIQSSFISSLQDSEASHNSIVVELILEPLKTAPKASKLSCLGVGSLLAIQTLIELAKILSIPIKYSQNSFVSYREGICLPYRCFSSLLELPVFLGGVTQDVLVSTPSQLEYPVKGIKTAPEASKGTSGGGGKGITYFVADSGLIIDSNSCTQTYSRLSGYNAVGDITIHPIFEGNCTDESFSALIASNCNNSEVGNIYAGGISVAKSIGIGKGLGGGLVFNAKGVQDQYTDIERKTFKEYITKKNLDGTPFVTSKDVYMMWRDAIIYNKLTKVTKLPYAYKEAAKESASYGQMFIKYCEGHDYETFPDFLDDCMRGWSSLRLHLKPYWGEVSTFQYPTITTFNFLFDHVLVWHDGFKNSKSVASTMSAAIKAKVSPSISKVNSVNSDNPPKNVSLQFEDDGVYSNELQGKVVETKIVETKEVGYTYLNGKKFNSHGGINDTYEERYVEALRSGDQSMINLTLQALKSKSKDLEGSMVRVKQLMDAQPA